MSRIPCQFCETCSKPACSKKVMIYTPSPANKTMIPFDSLPGEMSLDTCDVIMSLVSIAENSTTEWWKNYNYCEDISDGRGMTVSLVGFCSGTNDLLWVMKDLQKIKQDHPLLKYMTVLEKVDNTSNTKGLESFSSDLQKYGDDNWRKAVWNGILHFYWNPAIQYAAEIKLQFPISKGFLYDLALNHGAEEMSRMARQVRVASPKFGGDEKLWLSEMIAVRQNIIVNVDRSTNAGQPDRCILWNSILKKRNVDLNRPLHDLICYGEKFTIT